MCIRVITKPIVSSIFETINYSPSTKKALLDYMNSVEPNSAGGRVFDYCLNKDTGIENVGREDGIYLWSSKDMYYLEKYNAAVSDGFIKHVMQLTNNY